MPDQSNVQRSRLWRSVVASTLRLLGFPHAEPRASRSFREALESGPQSDVEGLPREVFLSVRSDLGPDWGPALDATEQSAHLLGREVGCVIQYRRVRDDPADAFAVLSLRGLATLLRAAYPPEWANLGEFERDLAPALDAPDVPHLDAPEEDG